MTMDQNFNPPAGVMKTLEPGLRRILAPNPSPMTWRGTNTYIIGHGHVAVIDPGPNDPAHLQAILSATRGEIIQAVFVTHSHIDHSPLARPLAGASGAPVLAFGNSQAGRSQMMRDLLDQGMSGGGEGIDADFQPDQTLKDNETISGKDWELTALWSPGHMANHMCFIWGDALFSGDHVMGWASSLVSPPDGDLTQFMASCTRLSARKDRIYHPGHGAPVTDPQQRIQWLIRHRKNREAQILAALSGETMTASAITAMIYTDTPAALLPAAERNVFAHLIDLAAHRRVEMDKTLSLASKFRRL